MWMISEFGNKNLLLKILEIESGFINFSSLSITKLPQIILDLCEDQLIKDLNLSNNNIRVLPVQLRYVKKVHLTNNPLTCLPVALREAKWSKIKRYLDEIEVQSTSFNLRKLVILGEDATGKTVNFFSSFSSSFYFNF